MNTLSIQPRFGRDYKSKALLLADWEANKDFTVSAAGQSVSKSCMKYLLADGVTRLQFRYKALRSTFTISIGE